MSKNAVNTKRIARNTVMLYIRMLFVMGITLFTSRVVLKELGFEDYGLYNVVGGVVALFSFLKSSMNSSTQRFLSYEMGKGDAESLRNIFSVCLTSHFAIALILLVLAETVGLWFLNTQINIPEGRELAANWIYQFSVISLFLSIISIPYSADVISNERMGYFAFLGVLEAVLKLVISYMIIVSPIDKLVFYGFLMMMVTLITLVLNWVYCHKRFAETHFRFYWNKDDFKKVFSFSGWTIWGQLAVVGSNQGSNILVNMFFSVTANAAMGVGHQVNNAITGLVSNFQTAFKPQLTKSYAEGDYDYLNRLSQLASKVSFSLLFLVALPIVLNIDLVLDIWLDKVPVYANTLCIIFIVASLCNAVSAPLWMNIFATGRIKVYQIALSIAYLVELVIVYLLFKCGVSLVWGIMMKAALNFVVIFIRLFYVHREVPEFDTVQYFYKVFLPLFLVTLATFIISFFTINCEVSLPAKLLFSAFVEIVAVLLLYFVGFGKNERKSLLSVMKRKK